MDEAEVESKSIDSHISCFFPEDQQIHPLAIADVFAFLEPTDQFELRRTCSLFCEAFDVAAHVLLTIPSYTLSNPSSFPIVFGCVSTAVGKMATSHDTHSPSSPTNVVGGSVAKKTPFSPTCVDTVTSSFLHVVPEDRGAKDKKAVISANKTLVQLGGGGGGGGRLAADLSVFFNNTHRFSSSVSSSTSELFSSSTKKMIRSKIKARYPLKGAAAVVGGDKKQDKRERRNRQPLLVEHLLQHPLFQFSSLRHQIMRAFEDKNDGIRADAETNTTTHASYLPTRRGKKGAAFSGSSSSSAYSPRQASPSPFTRLSPELSSNRVLSMLFGEDNTLYEALKAYLVVAAEKSSGKRREKLTTRAVSGEETKGRTVQQADEESPPTIFSAFGIPPFVRWCYAPVTLTYRKRRGHTKKEGGREVTTMGKEEVEHNEDDEEVGSDNEKKVDSGVFEEAAVGKEEHEETKQSKTSKCDVQIPPATIVNLDVIIENRYYTALAAKQARIQREIVEAKKEQLLIEKSLIQEERREIKRERRERRLRVHQHVLNQQRQQQEIQNLMLVGKDGNGQQRKRKKRGGCSSSDQTDVSTSFASEHHGDEHGRRLSRWSIIHNEETSKRNNNNNAMTITNLGRTEHFLSAGLLSAASVCTATATTAQFINFGGGNTACSLMVSAMTMGAGDREDMHDEDDDYHNDPEAAAKIGEGSLESEESKKQTDASFSKTGAAEKIITTPLEPHEGTSAIMATRSSFANSTPPFPLSPAPPTPTAQQDPAGGLNHNNNSMDSAPVSSSPAPPQNISFSSSSRVRSRRVGSAIAHQSHPLNPATLRMLRLQQSQQQNQIQINQSTSGALYPVVSGGFGAGTSSNSANRSFLPPNAHQQTNVHAFAAAGLVSTSSSSALYPSHSLGTVGPQQSLSMMASSTYPTTKGGGGDVGQTRSQSGFPSTSQQREEAKFIVLDPPLMSYLDGLLAGVIANTIIVTNASSVLSLGDGFLSGTCAKRVIFGHQSTLFSSIDWAQEHRKAQQQVSLDRKKKMEIKKKENLTTVTESEKKVYESGGDNAEVDAKGQRGRPFVRLFENTIKTEEDQLSSTIHNAENPLESTLTKDLRREKETVSAAADPNGASLSPSTCVEPKPNNNNNNAVLCPASSSVPSYEGLNDDLIPHTEHETSKVVRDTNQESSSSSSSSVKRPVDDEPNQPQKPFFSILPKDPRVLKRFASISNKYQLLPIDTATFGFSVPTTAVPDADTCPAYRTRRELQVDFQQRQNKVATASPSASQQGRQQQQQAYPTAQRNPFNPQQQQQRAPTDNARRQNNNPFFADNNTNANIKNNRRDPILGEDGGDHLGHVITIAKEREWGGGEGEGDGDDVSVDEDAIEREEECIRLQLEAELTPISTESSSYCSSFEEEEEEGEGEDTTTCTSTSSAANHLPQQHTATHARKSPSVEGGRPPLLPPRRNSSGDSLSAHNLHHALRSPIDDYVGTSFSSPRSLLPSSPTNTNNTCTTGVGVSTRVGGGSGHLPPLPPNAVYISPRAAVGAGGGLGTASNSRGGTPPGSFTSPRVTAGGPPAQRALRRVGSTSSSMAASEVHCPPTPTPSPTSPSATASNTGSPPSALKRNSSYGDVSGMRTGGGIHAEYRGKEEENNSILKLTTRGRGATYAPTSFDNKEGREREKVFTGGGGGGEERGVCLHRAASFACSSSALPTSASAVARLIMEERYSSAAGGGGAFLGGSSSQPYTSSSQPQPLRGQTSSLFSSPSYPHLPSAPHSPSSLSGTTTATYMQRQQNAAGDPSAFASSQSNFDFPRPPAAAANVKYVATSAEQRARHLQQKLGASRACLARELPKPSTFTYTRIVRRHTPRIRKCVSETSSQGEREGHALTDDSKKHSNEENEKKTKPLWSRETTAVYTATEESGQEGGGGGVKGKNKKNSSSDSSNDGSNEDEYADEEDYEGDEEGEEFQEIGEEEEEEVEEWDEASSSSGEYTDADEEEDDGEVEYETVSIPRYTAESLQPSTSLSIALIGSDFLSNTHNMSFVDFRGFSQLQRVENNFLAFNRAMEVLTNMRGLGELRSVGDRFLFACSKLLDVCFFEFSSLISVGDGWLSHCRSIRRVEVSHVDTLRTVGSGWLASNERLESAVVGPLISFRLVGDKWLFGNKRLNHVVFGPMPWLEKVTGFWLAECTALEDISFDENNNNSARDAQRRLHDENENEHYYCSSRRRRHHDDTDSTSDDDTESDGEIEDTSSGDEHDDDSSSRSHGCTPVRHDYDANAGQRSPLVSALRGGRCDSEKQKGEQQHEAKSNSTKNSDTPSPAPALNSPVQKGLFSLMRSPKAKEEGGGPHEALSDDTILGKKEDGRKIPPPTNEASQQGIKKKEGRNRDKRQVVPTPSVINKSSNSSGTGGGGGGGYTLAFPRLASVGTHWLFRCQSLREIDFQRAGVPMLVTVGNFWMAGCSSLTRVDFQGLYSLEAVGANWLVGAHSLKVIDMRGMPELRIINSNFLFDCQNLSQISFASKLMQLTTVGNRFICRLPSLRSIDFKGLRNLTSVGDGFLSYCPTLISVDFSDLKSLQSVGKDWFLESNRVACPPPPLLLPSQIKAAQQEEAAMKALLRESEQLRLAQAQTSLQQTAEKNNALPGGNKQDLSGPTKEEDKPLSCPSSTHTSDTNIALQQRSALGHRRDVISAGTTIVGIAKGTYSSTSSSLSRASASGGRDASLLRHVPSSIDARDTVLLLKEIKEDDDEFLLVSSAVVPAITEPSNSYDNVYQKDGGGMGGGRALSSPQTSLPRMCYANGTSSSPSPPMVRGGGGVNNNNNNNTNSNPDKSNTSAVAATKTDGSSGSGPHPTNTSSSSPAVPINNTTSTSRPRRKSRIVSADDHNLDSETVLAGGDASSSVFYMSGTPQANDGGHQHANGGAVEMEDVANSGNNPDSDKNKNSTKQSSVEEKEKEASGGGKGKNKEKEKSSGGFFSRFFKKTKTPDEIAMKAHATALKEYSERASAMFQPLIPHLLSVAGGALPASKSQKDAVLKAMLAVAQSVSTGVAVLPPLVVTAPTPVSSSSSSHPSPQ